MPTRRALSPDAQKRTDLILAYCPVFNSSRMSTPLALHAYEPRIDTLNCPTVFYGCLLLIRGKGRRGCSALSICLFGLFLRPHLSLQFSEVLLVEPHHYSEKYRHNCKRDANT